MKKSGLLLFILFLFSSSGAFCSPYRAIAILENERRLRAEPDISLLSYFDSNDPKIRARAILAAARIGNKAALVPLHAHLTDSDANVRRYVAFALGQIRAKEGLADALKMMEDKDPELKRLAIEAVGRIGGLESSAAISRFLNDNSPALREQAALALALIKDKATVPLLIQKCDVAPVVQDTAQWSYVYALYRLADVRSVDALHAVLANPQPSPSTGDPSSLLFALKALWSMKKPLNSTEAGHLLHHADPRVQQNALDVLSAAGDKSSCAVINETYAGMNRISRWKAIEAMGNLGCSLPQIESKDPLLYGASVLATSKINKDNALNQIISASQDSSWVIRWYAAQALSNLSREKAVPVLQKLAQDTDNAVKLGALDSIANFSSETADYFVPLLEDSDFAVRATAADAIGKTKDPKYLPLLLKTYARSHAATEIEGRTAVLDVLADFNSSEALSIYEDALADPEYTIRRHAIDGIKKLVGSQYYWNGKLKDPEDFLYIEHPVSAKTFASYPADFGEPVADIEAEMKLEKGTVVIRLLASEAPLLVTQFRNLAEHGFYDGLRIHRVVPNFVIQGGDPRGDGWGGAGEIIHDQMNLQIYKRGMVGLPIAGKDTGGGQFFITMSRQPHLDGNYTIFGEVLSGIEFVDSTTIGDKILKVQIKHLPANSNKTQ